MFMKELPGVVDLLKASWETYKNNWKYLTRVYLLGLLCFILVIALPVILLGLALITIPSPASFFVIGIGAGIAVVASIFISYWMNLAIGQAVVNTDTDESFSARDTFKFTKPLVGVYFLTASIMSGIILSGFMALIIPGIVLSLWFSLAMYTFLVDEQRGARALILSREYARGYTGKLFIYFFVFAIVVNLLVGTLPQYIFQHLDLMFLSFIWNTAVALISAPLGMLFSYNVYKAIKAQKGKLDVDYSKERRRKYIIVSLLPLIFIVLFIALAINVLSSNSGLLLDTLNNIDSSSQEEWNVPIDEETLS